MELWSDEQERPLQHIRVVDLTVMLPGPWVTRMLAQYGADILKIEATPDGDPLRNVSQTRAFELLNQGKRSVAINLHSEKGVEIVRRLASESDVFIENYREGVMDRYGLGYSHLSEDNPDILYVSLRGIKGEFAKMAAHDMNFIAASGCGEWFLENGSPNFSTHFGDIVGGALTPLTRMLFHLANPARRGMHLLNYMDEGFRTLYLTRAWDSLVSEKVTTPPEKGTPSSEKSKAQGEFGLHALLNGAQPHSRYYRCRDEQWISLNAVQPKHWEIFCRAVDHVDWIARHADRSLTADLEKLFHDAPSNYWEVLVKGHDACLVRVVPWAEHLSHTDTRAKMSSDPLTWAGFAPSTNLKGCPELGHDTFSVLHGAGLDNQEIAELIQNGDVKSG